MAKLTHALYRSIHITCDNKKIRFYLGATLYEVDSLAECKSLIDQYFDGKKN